jgi:hypothetical protein
MPLWRSPLLAATAVAVANGAFGGHNLAHQGLWPDEAFSLRAAQLAPDRLVEFVTRHESNNALYYGFLHAWQAGGTGEIWLRLPSLAFGIATAVVLFALNLRLFGLAVATTASTLLAFNLFFIRYVQETRTYALTLLLVTAATFAFVTAVERPSGRRLTLYVVVARWRSTPTCSPRWWWRRTWSRGSYGHAGLRRVSWAARSWRLARSPRLSWQPWSSTGKWGRATSPAPVQARWNRCSSRSPVVAALPARGRAGCC